jgi:hypothetical protein
MDVVQHVNRAPAEPYHPGAGITLRPGADIDIPSERNPRRNPAESGYDVWPADITGVDDMRHPGQVSLSLWMYEPGVSEMTPPLTCISLPASPTVRPR